MCIQQVRYALVIIQINALFMCPLSDLIQKLRPTEHDELKRKTENVLRWRESKKRVDGKRREGKKQQQTNSALRLN